MIFRKKMIKMTRDIFDEDERRIKIDTRESIMMDGDIVIIDNIQEYLEIEFESRKDDSNPRIWFEKKYPDFKSMPLDEIKELVNKDFKHGNSSQYIYEHIIKHNKMD